MEELEALREEALQKYNLEQQKFEGMNLKEKKAAVQKELESSLNP